MASIRIRNIGPILDSGIIELSAVNLFIGKQSSGKSTLLKILCYCRWLDKQFSIGTKIGSGTKRTERSVTYAYSHHYRFVRELMHFYRLNESFFNEESSIEYIGDGVDVHFKGTVSNNAQVIAKTEGEKYNSKLCFVPSERNLLSSMKNIQDGYKSSDMDILFNFVFEWAEFRERFTPANKLRLNVAPEMEYYYDKDKGEQILINKRGKEIPPFSPFYASSGIQSALPLEVIIKSSVDFIGKNARLSQSDLTQIVARLIREGASPEILQRTIDASRKLLDYQGIQLFIEEPEQNLFPESQASVIKSIVSTVRMIYDKGANSRSMVVMTTHSPYVLSSLNVLMAASEAYSKDPERTKRIVPEKYILPKGAIRAFQIDTEGIVHNIIDPDIYMVDGTFLDKVSDSVEDKLSLLNEIICL